MRTITGQKDYGLEPKVDIEADDRDDFGGGTSNYYWLHTLQENGERKVFAEIQFQYGPRNDPKSKPGIADSDLIHVLIDRYEGFQAGPYACPENAVTLQLLRDTLASTRVRADRRKEQGVLGKNEQHMTFVAVESSNVDSMCYIPETSELHVRFKGKDAPTHYVYANVPNEVHESMLRADSVGKYFAAFVKNRYECRKVSA